MCLLFFQFSLLLILNKALTDSSTCSTYKAYPVSLIIIYYELHIDIYLNMMSNILVHIAYKF